jgi:hypothetical protein
MTGCFFNSCTGYLHQRFIVLLPRPVRIIPRPVFKSFASLRPQANFELLKKIFMCQKLFFAGFLLLFALVADAQSTSKPVVQKMELGFIAGLNLEQFYGKDDYGDKLHHSLKPGFRAGITAAWPFASHLALQAGLLYSQRGSRQKTEGDMDIQFHVSYLELPIHFLYKPLLGWGKLVLGAGPYLAYGLGGHVGGAGNPDHKVVFTSTVEHRNEYTTAYFIKRFDMGIDLVAGYEWQRYSILLSGHQGFYKLNPVITDYPEYAYRIKSKGISISAAYKF